ncbi:MAG: HdeD family acid-resistance protein [Bauldia sp.]|nr:HdeD family acid-resistance protein [Bauldia sp.]
MSNAAAMRLNAIESIREHWGWFLALGIIFIIAGVFAIVAPMVAGLTVTIVFSIVLVWLGIMAIIQAFGTKSWGGFIWELLIGLVLLVGGVATWINPVLAALSLTIVVGAVFLAKGVIQAVMSFQMRPHSGWGWMLTAGILSVIVGLIILIQWPLSTAYALGYLAGISLIFSGWSYVMISLAAKRV